MKNILGTFLSIFLSLILLSNAGGIALQQQQAMHKMWKEAQLPKKIKTIF